MQQPYKQVQQAQMQVIEGQHQQVQVKQQGKQEGKQVQVQVRLVRMNSSRQSSRSSRLGWSGCRYWQAKCRGMFCTKSLKQWHRCQEMMNESTGRVVMARFLRRRVSGMQLVSAGLATLPWKCSTSWQAHCFGGTTSSGRTALLTQQSETAWLEDRGGVSTSGIV
jgi:hypothetical protein